MSWLIRASVIAIVNYLIMFIYILFVGIYFHLAHFISSCQRYGNIFLVFVICSMFPCNENQHQWKNLRKILGAFRKRRRIGRGRLRVVCMHVVSRTSWRQKGGVRRRTESVLSFRIIF